MDHHPFTHIIFDTRKGKPYVCAACKGGFGSDGQELKELLTQGLNHFLGRYGLEIALTRLKKKREEFWNSVDDIVRLFDDRPVYIKIDFSQSLYDKCPPAECDDAIVAAIMQIASMKGGGNRVLNIRNHSKNEIHLNEMQETLVHVAQHCLRYPQHTLQIRFRNYGLYRVGNDVEARFTVDKKLIEQFASGQQKMVFGPNECSLSLLEWLEGIYQLLTEYHDETALEPPAAAMYC